MQAGHKVRYFTAADLAETLYRGLADNSVGKIIDTLLRNDLIIIDEVGFAPLDDTGAQLLFRVVAAAYERRALGIAVPLALRQSAYVRGNMCKAAPVLARVHRSLGKPPVIDVVGEVVHDALGLHAERGGDELGVDRVDQVREAGAAH